MQARRSPVSALSGQPVGDAVLSRLYRADAAEIGAIALTLPRVVRAQLAAFCYARAHLRAIGREVARHCDDAALSYHAGGALGPFLVELNRSGVSDGADAFASRPGKPRVTLASAADMRRREPIVDFDDESDVSVA